jgi:hypothetical protein
MPAPVVTAPGRGVIGKADDHTHPPSRLVFITGCVTDIEPAFCASTIPPHQNQW